ncbi:MAG: phosphatidylserine/phosphatidylglycerophosphate/cardiolipin synthase family protein [Pseudomonadota bacterium]|nr:phosphatidylserine/phosphatidylglycerophosphate/cardiolipin synthase family protein [Pseudomonadota bacterium]
MRLRFAPILALALGCRAGRPLLLADPLDGALPAVDDCAAFADPELDARLDDRTDSVARGGNAVRLLVNGVEAFARRYENAADADLVLVKTYIFTDDETGRAVADLLRARARAGATVVVQYDLKGSLDGATEALALYGETRDERILRDKPILADLVRDGVHVVATNVPRTIPGALRLFRAQEKVEARRGEGRTPVAIGGALTRFDHEKYWITGHISPDGQITLRAILGGMNIASEYAYGGTDRVDAGSTRGGWRDTDIEVVGPVTTDIVRRYFDVLGANVEAWPAGIDRMRWEVPQPDAGAAEARFVWNQPSGGNGRHIERLYRALVRATPTESSVRLASAYFTPGPLVRRPLLQRLRAGGRVAVLTNSPASTDIGIVTTASRGAYDTLLGASPRAALYEWRPKLGLHTLHSKVASFGTCGPVIVGSANLDGLSSLNNSESVLVVTDPTLRATLDASFDLDLGNADRITQADLAMTPGLVRWSQRGVYWIGWRFLAL